MSAVTIRAAIFCLLLLSCRSNESGLIPPIAPESASTSGGTMTTAGGTSAGVVPAGEGDPGGPGGSLAPAPPAPGSGGIAGDDPAPGGAPEVDAGSAQGPPDMDVVVAPEVAPEVDPGPPPLGAGLVAHLKLDESAGLRAGDATGGNAASLRGGAHFVAGGFTSARFPNAAALVFDGLDDDAIIEAPILPPVHAPQTISLWVRYARLPPGTREFIALSNRSQSCGIHLGTRTGVLGVWMWGGDPLLSTPAPAPGWHHVAYATDGDLHRLYLNGVQVDLSATAGQRCVVTEAALGNYPGGGNHFEGTLDDIRIYGRALDRAEVRLLADGFDLQAPD